MLFGSGSSTAHACPQFAPNARKVKAVQILDKVKVRYYTIYTCPPRASDKVSSCKTGGRRGFRCVPNPLRRLSAHSRPHIRMSRQMPQGLGPVPVDPSAGQEIRCNSNATPGGVKSLGRSVQWFLLAKRSSLLSSPARSLRA